MTTLIEGGDSGFLLIDAVRPGRPRSKGSLKAYCLKNRAHTVRVEEQVTDSPLWRLRMAKTFQMDMIERHGKLLNHGGAVQVSLEFRFERERSVTGAVLPSHDTVYPIDMGLGDSDKLIRNALDALTDAHVIEDDRLVVDIAHTKRWGDRAGVRCIVWALP